MSGIRVLVGTRKGAFVLTSDAKRERWNVSAPLFAGWEIYHLKGSPADPNRLYASQSSSWFGQIIQRSDDGGKTWHQPGTPPGEPTTTPDGMPKGESNKFVYDTSSETGKPLTTHQWYDGTPHPWEFKRVWHLEPSLTRSRHGLRRGRRRCLVPLDRRRADVAGASGSARPRFGGLVGSRAPVGCACTPSFSTRVTRTGFSPRFRRQAHSVPTTRARPGSRSTVVSIRSTSPTRPRRSVTAFTESR